MIEQNKPVKSKKRKLKNKDIQKKKKVKLDTNCENEVKEKQSESVQPAEIENDNELDNDESLFTGSHEEAETNQILEEEEMKFSKDFRMSVFREKLRGNNFIPDLRHFLELSRNNGKLVAKYIEKKGKPLEFAEAMERIDKSHLFNVSYVCEALQLVLMEILVNKKEHTKNAINASRFFLKSHGQVIEKLLKSPCLKHRKIILKLMTAIVCLEPELGRQLLSSFDFLLNPAMISSLLSHSMAEINEIETVRKVFIHFILSYLIDGNVVLIRNILDKGNLLKSVISGLMHDDYVTACVVLSSIQKYIIENSEILKTSKIYVFDFECVKNLLRLYDWLGPKAFGKKLKEESDLQPTQIESDEQKKAVRDAVHQLLLVLLTSRKHGLAFDSMSNFKQKRNTLQKKLMIVLKLPWLDDLKKDLMKNVLKSCPDTARAIIKHYGASLNYLKTGKMYWVKVANFMSEMIAAMDPIVLKKALDKITLTEYAFWIKDICLSAESLVHLQHPKALMSEDHQIRIATTKLLLTMFRQFCNYMITILTYEKYKGTEMRRFKLDMINYIFVNFPSMENILVSAFETTKQFDYNSENKFEHLDLILDLVLLVATHHRTFFNKTALVIDFIQLLEPLFNSDDLGTKNIKLELKAIKTMLLLTPLKLSPNGNLYEKVLNCFVKAFIEGDEKNQKEVGNLLRGLFLNTSFFSENNIIEIDIWLEALKYIDSTSVELIILILYACFQSSSEDVEEELAEVNKNNDKKVEKEHKNKLLKHLFEKIETGQTVEGFVETLTLSKLLPYICVKVEKEENVNNFLELVSLLLFHYIPVSDDLYEVYSSNFEQHKSYMKNILKKNKIQKMPNTVVIPFYNDIHQALLNGEQIFFELFEDKENKSALRLSEDIKEYAINDVLENERLITLYIQLTTFVTNHLVANESFTENHYKSSYQFLKYFLTILHDRKSKDDINFKIVVFGELDAISNHTTDITYLDTILKYFYCNHLEVIQSFEMFAESESKKTFLKFLCAVNNFVGENFQLSNFEELLLNFQKKIIHQIESEIKNTLRNNVTPKSCFTVEILESFRITHEQCMEILKALCKLNYRHFIDESGPQNRSIYYDILIFILNRTAELKHSLTDKTVCETIAKFYTDLMLNCEDHEMSLEKFEDSLHSFLSISHQCIESLPSELFEKFFEYKKVTKSTIKIATLIFERNSSLIDIFVSNLKESLTKKELIYPLLNVLIEQNPNFDFDEKLLKEIYQEFKNGFLKTIDKPQKAGVIYKENVDVSIYLVTKSMPLNECIDFAKKSIKTDAVEVYQLKLINGIYHKAISSLEVDSNDYKIVFNNFINNFMQLYNILLKRESFDETKSNYLNYMFYAWIKLYYKNNDEKTQLMDFAKIKNSQTWNLLVKNLLKFGLQIFEEISMDQINSKYLKILAYVCSVILEKNDKENDEICQMYESILSHSRFSEIVLNIKHSAVKTEIFNLLLVLAQKNAKVLNEKHIPMLLGSYHAKLTNCDRYILALIQYYEISGVNLYKFRPFIWGETAITHYSLTKLDTATLEQQEPSIDQIMSLIDPYISNFTLKNFPVWRKLNSLKQLPEQVFEDPDNLVFDFGANVVEKSIEYESFTNNETGQNSKSEIDSAVLKLCLKKDIVYEKCYDPAFIVPIMCMCYAAEVQAQPVRPVQNGLLGIVFAALSSQDKEMRLAAACCQLRYRERIEGKKFFDQLLWLQIYDNIQNGLSQLQTDWLKHKKHGVARVPYVSGLFLARAVNLLIKPANPLYKTMVMYLRLKETFDFLCVPEFNVLFHSSEINHTSFQQFILEVINDGVKCSSDLFVLISNNIFKAIMGFYFSVMSNLELNLQILLIMSTCAKIPSFSKLLVEYIGIIPWLNGVIEQLEYYKFDSIEAVISILNNLYFSIKIKEDDFYNYKFIESQIFKLSVKLCPCISARISVNNFARYLNILQKTAGKNHKILKEESLDRLLLCAQKHFEEDVWRISNIRKYGSSGVESKETFLRRMKQNSTDVQRQLALLNLREFVISWTTKDICN